MKKSGTRVFSLVLTLILAFALAVPAFAADVTIDSEHNENATYGAYQLMTLTTSLKCGETDSTGHVHDEGCYNYSYKINSKYEDILKEVLNKDGADEGKTMDQTIMDAIAAKRDGEVRDLAEALYDKIKETEPSLDFDATLDQGTPETLEEGYWLIVDSTATLPDGVTRSLVMLDTAGKEDITIEAKDETIDIGKTVTTPDVNLTPETSAEYGTVNIGDTITFTLTSSLPADLDKYTHPTKKYQFKFVDNMSAGLEFIAITYVKIGDNEVPAYTDEEPGYKTSGFFAGETPNGKGEIDLSTYVQANQGTLRGKKVEVKYTAKLTEDAVVDNGTIKEENKVYVEFTNDYDDFQGGRTPEEDVDVYSFTLDIFKYTDDNGTEGYQPEDTHLAGAEFQLYKTVGGKTYYAKANQVTGGEGGNYKITGWAETTDTDVVPAGAATFVTPEGGKLDIDGLDLGTYYLRETKAPDGYNLLAEPIVIKIEDKAGDGADAPIVEIPVQHVKNSSGVELPSTGGIGTTIFYTLGGLLAVGAAVFLVTKKRMSGVEE